MSITTSMTINWSDLYVAPLLQNIAREVRHIRVTSTDIYDKSQQTIINGVKDFSSDLSGLTFNIIPNEVDIESKTIKFSKVKRIELKAFPKILDFISSYSPYIYDFIQDQNIENVDIRIQKPIKYSPVNDNTISQCIEDFLSMKTLLENNDELYPIVFAALIQRFYQQNDNEFKLQMHPTLLKIRKYIDHVNNLFDVNVHILKNYELKLSQDTYSLRDRKFEFLDNNLFSITYPKMYEQNMEIKFLSYISCPDLKEKATNGKNNSNILL